MALLLAGTLVLAGRCVYRCASGAEKKEAPAKGVAQRPKTVNLALKEKVEAFVDGLPHPRLLALQVYDLTADTVLVSHRADSLMPTASCQKLLTAVAAVHRLGLNRVFCTRLLVTGKMSADTLKGNIVLRAGFDPLLQEEDLVSLFKTLRKRGIRHLDGKVVVDLQNHQAIEPEQHWKPWDVPRRKWGLCYRGGERMMRTVKYLVRAQGVRVADGSFTFGACPPGARQLAVAGHPIKLSVERMMLNSSNVNAESMLYPLGHSFKRKGADCRAAGLEYLRRFVSEKLGRTDSCHSLHDGCGLCPENSMTPSLLCSLLRYAYHRREVYALLRRTLPVAGKTGTLAREMTRSKARGKVQAKTGTLTTQGGISTLSGYFTGADGRHYAFSIMCRQTPVADARLLQSRLCSIFVQ